MKSSILFVVVLSIIVLSCHTICTPAKYNCSGGSANIYPDVDSIRLGDTLWLSSIIPLNVKYSQGNNFDSTYYNLSGATNVITDFHITTPSGITMQSGAIDSFSFTALKGSIKSNPLIPDAGKTISYEEEGDKYIFSLSMIAQKKGIYFFSIIDIYQARKKCDKISVVTIMNNPDNHLHYLKDLYYGGGSINPLDSTHTYCFKVY